jgi:Ca2+-binding RTX toxin-like protein
MSNTIDVWAPPSVWGTWNHTDGIIITNNSTEDITLTFSRTSDLSSNIVVEVVGFDGNGEFIQTEVLTGDDDELTITIGGAPSAGEVFFRVASEGFSQTFSVDSGDTPFLVGGAPSIPTSPNATYPDIPRQPAPSPIIGDGDIFHAQTFHTDPLVIDLSAGHTGITLTTFNPSTTTTFFDMTNSGFAQQTAWTSGDTGFLVRDLNANGTIDNITEMFGTSGADGFAKLITLDSNHDLKLDASDAAWGTLQVWLDANGNGVTDAGELHSLSSLGITSIDLAGISSSASSIDGNAISHTSTVSFSSGASATIADAWLAGSDVNTYYTGSFTLDPDTELLPDLRGFGHLPDLTISLSQDSVLKGLVETMSSDFSTSGFAGALDSDTTNILYQWAGVEGVDPASRGGAMDARQLEFLEHLFGVNYVQNSEVGSANPNDGAAPFIEKAWQDVFQRFEDQLILQEGGSALFTNPVAYNPWTGTTSGDTSLSETAVDGLATNAPSDPTANVAYWTEVGHFIDVIKGVGNVTSTEATWLDSTIHSTNVNLSWDDIVNIVGGIVPTDSISGTSGNDTIMGTDGADTIQGLGGTDTIHGGAANDSLFADLSTGFLGSVTGNATIYGDAGSDLIWGGEGNDVLHGGDGNDTIHGFSGNDTIWGDAGGNVLDGGAGDDIYMYTAGADDLINEGGAGGNDQIILPAGMTLADVTFTRVPDSTGTVFNDLLMTFHDGGSIQIAGQLGSDASFHIETLKFNDGSTFNLTTLTDLPVYLTPGDDTVDVGALPNVNNTVYGLDGNDFIVTGSGNDTLDGGSGNDQLRAGTGNDSYVASAGFDTILDDGGTDSIVIPAAYIASQVTLYRGGGHDLNDLIIDVQGLGEIRIENQFASTTNAIENLHFLSDGSTVSLTGQTIMTLGTDAPDFLTAPTIDAGADAVMFGYGGADRIFGGSGNDTINGGAGNDQLFGGTGNDTYVFAPGSGSDQIIENLGEGTDTIHFSGIAASNIHMSTDTGGSLILVDIANPSDTITVNGGITGSGLFESKVGQYVEQVTFDDGTTWNLTGGLNLTTDSAGDPLYGTAFGDTLNGTSGNEHLFGNGGDDTLIGGAGNDLLQGGIGNDTYVFAPGFGNAQINENLSEGTDTIRFTGISPSSIHMWTDSFGQLFLQNTADPSHEILVTAGTTGMGTSESTVGQYVEKVTFDNGTIWDLTGGLTLTADTTGDPLYGTAFGDTLNGTSGNDRIFGNRGDDTIVGGAGNDLLMGGTGNDTYVFTPGFGNTQINENLGEGTDTIHFTGINPANIRMWTDSFGELFLQNTADPTHSILVTAGTTGSGTSETTVGQYVEQITFDSSYGVTWNLAAGLNLTADNAGDFLYGSAGTDTITGGTGADHLYGNGGNDTLIGGAGNDSLDGGAGTDTASYAAAPAGIVANLGTGSVTDGYGGTDTLTSIENIIGSGFNDTITGDSNANTLTGGAGNDILAGRGGADILDGGTGIDTADYSAAAAALTVSLTTGTASNDGDGSSDTLLNIENITGSAFNDTITGDANANTLSGGAGNDILAGRGGADIIDGGAGTDTVDYSAAVSGVIVNLGAGTASNDGDGSSDTLTNLENITGSAFDDNLTGDGNANTIDGGAGNDTIEGGAGNDTLTGNTGIDTLTYVHATAAVTVNLATATAQNTVGAGTDTISGFENLTGSAFNDTLTGDGNNNIIQGLAGNDTLVGGAGTDTVTYVDSTAGVTVSLALTTAQNTVGAGTDTISGFENLTGSAFNDTLTGDANANVIDGGAGNDIIQGGAGNDTLIGGAGIDTLTYAAATAAVTVNLATATAQNTSGAGTDTISGFENLIGSAFNDTLTGDANNNVIEGLAGNDTMNGGAGIDTLTYVDATAAITISLAVTTAQSTGGAGSDTISNFENLIGSAFNDTLTGDGNNNVIEGLAGNDTMNGGAGTDTLTYVDATAGITISLAVTTAQTTGGAGSDTISNFENLTGSNFNDTLTGSTGNNVIEGLGGNDTMNGGAGTDTVTYVDSTAGVTVSLAITTAQNTIGAGTDTISNFENLTGSNFDDTLTGDANANVLQGLAGNDMLSGGAGNDTLDGGAGTDTATFASAASGVTVNLSTNTATGDGSDTLISIENVIGSTHNDTFVTAAGIHVFDGGAGTDTLSYAPSSVGVTVNLFAGTGVGDGTDSFTNIENIIGSSHNDTITSNSGANVIDGGAGTDTVSYASASAAVFADLSLGTATGDGSDTLTNIENVTGSANNDTLNGNSGVNVLTGGAGNDTLYGGGGADTLIGGTGLDTFLFKAATAMSASVTIQDFNTAENDRIDISDVLHGHYDPLTNAIADFVQLTTSGSDTLLKVDLDGTGSGFTPTQIATIHGVTGLDLATLVANGELVVS